MTKIIPIKDGEEKSNFTYEIASFTITDILSSVVYLFMRDQLDQSAEKGDDSQWFFEFKFGDCFVYLYDKDEYTVHAIFEQNEKPEDSEYPKRLQSAFIELLRKNAPRYQAKLKEATNHPNGYLITNPYATYFLDGEKLLEEAEEIEEFRMDFLNPSSDRQPQITVEYIKELRHKEELQSVLCHSAFFLFVASFEGLLNLIYELYLKQHLREERISGRLTREQVDVKLRLAPTYCSCFKSEEIRFKNDEFSRFQQVVNLRNNFIHANLTSPMKVPYVQYDDFLFAVPPEKEGKYGLPLTITQLSLSHVQFIRDTIKDVVDAVVSSMSPRYKREMKAILMEQEVSVDVVEGEYIVIVP